MLSSAFETLISAFSQSSIVHSHLGIGFLILCEMLANEVNILYLERFELFRAVDFLPDDAVHPFSFWRSRCLLSACVCVYLFPSRGNRYTASPMNINAPVTYMEVKT